jgi:hypothetical protein
MTPRSLSGWARAAGVGVGAGLAILLVIAARPTPQYARLPARVSLTVPVTGTLEVTPSAPHPVLAASSLTPDAGPAVRRFRVRNQTGETLRVRFRAKAEARDLDGLLRIRLDAAGQQLADTTLQGLRQGSESALRLRSGETRQVSLRAWIPNDAGDGYIGRQADVSLVPVVTTGG